VLDLILQSNLEFVDYYFFWVTFRKIPLIKSPPVAFSRERVKTFSHFFSFLADALSVSNEQAAIQYEIFLQKCFEEQNAILKIGNLGSVHKTGDQFNWVSSFQSASYFKDISISPIAIDVEEQVVSVKKVKWELVALILSLIAIVAILYKLL
jgi:hypothetical protein